MKPKPKPAPITECNCDAPFDLCTHGLALETPGLWRGEQFFGAGA